jgi:hypothetical protein
VSLRRSVGICILAIMTALPISGAVCTMLCSSARSSTELGTAHHHGAKHAAQSARIPNEAQIQGVSEHDCNSHDAVFRQAPATAAERADWRATPIALVSTGVPVTSKPLATCGPQFEYGAPPGAAPPTASQLVLRI